MASTHETRESCPHELCDVMLSKVSSRVSCQLLHISCGDMLRMCVVYNDVNFIIYIGARVEEAQKLAFLVELRVEKGFV